MEYIKLAFSIAALVISIISLILGIKNRSFATKIKIKEAQHALVVESLRLEQRYRDIEYMIDGFVMDNRYADHVSEFHKRIDATRNEFETKYGLYTKLEINEKSEDIDELEALKMEIMKKLEHINHYTTRIERIIGDIGRKIEASKHNNAN